MTVVNGLLRLLGQRALEYYDREPVRVQATVVALVLAGATALTLALPATLVTGIVAVLVPLLVVELRKLVASPQTQRELVLTDPDEAAEELIVGEVVGLDVERGE